MGLDVFSVRIPLHQIAADGLHLLGELPEPVRDALAVSLKVKRAPLSGQHRLSLHRHGTRVTVRGAIAAEGTLPCSACLAPAAWRQEIPVDVAIVPNSDLPAPLDGGELTNDAVEQYAYNHDTVDLTTVLHDEIVMELPLRLLCRENCLGLCAVCGINQNELGRACCCRAEKPSGPFAALAKLRRASADTKA